MGAGLEACRVRAGLGLGEGEGPEDLPPGEAGHVAGLLRLRAVGEEGVRTRLCCTERTERKEAHPPISSRRAR